MGITGKVLNEHLLRVRMGITGKVLNEHLPEYVWESLVKC